MTLKFVNQIDAHVGGVNDLAFSNPNKQLCVITCGDDKTIKVSYLFLITTLLEQHLFYRLYVCVLEV